MIKKFTFLLVIIFFTTNCGFTPIYSNKNINNISIDKLNFEGDRTLNNYLKSNLSRYKNNNSSKKINYLYVLTPKGIKEKTNITMKFIAKKKLEYDKLNSYLN